MSEVTEEKTVESELDLSKVYNLPHNIKIIKHNDAYLAIYTQGVLWIVLQNDEERDVFEEIIQKKPLGSLFESYSEEAVLNVVVQLEAKKFETPHTKEITDKGVYIYLTNNCNERCKHCYMYAGEVEVQELPGDKWIEVLTNLKAAGCSGVTFTGGEITVYKEFEKVIRHAHNIGLMVSVLTNGILWTDELVGRLSSSIDEVQVSIDGYDSSSYYAVRRYDGFKSAINCVKLFRKHGTKVSIAVTPLYDGLDEFIEGFEPFAEEFIHCYPDVLIKVNLELIKGRQINTTQDENAEYKRKLIAMVERLYPDFYTESFVLNYEDKKIRKNCGFGGISISADGNVFWCNRIHELTSIVNIFDHNIFEIMAMSERAKQNTSVDNTARCKTCEIKYICGGGCRLNYKGIEHYETHKGEWEYHCTEKERLLDKMIVSNEYFFEE